MAEHDTGRRRRAAPRRDGAAAWLATTLAAGPQPAVRLWAAAQAAGWAARTVARARAIVGVRVYRAEGRWYWQLAGTAPPPAPAASSAASAGPTALTGNLATYTMTVTGNLASYPGLNGNVATSQTALNGNLATYPCEVGNLATSDPASNPAPLPPERAAPSPNPPPRALSPETRSPEPGPGTPGDINNPPTPQVAEPGAGDETLLGGGGVRGGGTVRRTAPQQRPAPRPAATPPADAPPAVQAFDALLRDQPGYHPSAHYYALLTERYADRVDLALEGAKLLDWLQDHPHRQCSTRFVLNWLAKAAADRARPHLTQEATGDDARDPILPLGPHGTVHLRWSAIQDLPDRYPRRFVWRLGQVYDQQRRLYVVPSPTVDPHPLHTEGGIL